MRKLQVLLFLLSFIGCIKAPDQLDSTRIVIRTQIEDNKVKYTVKIITSIRNMNNDNAFFDYEGEIYFRDGKNRLQKSLINPIPFTVPSIFPFEAVPINLEVKAGEGDVKPLLDVLEIRADDVVKNGGTEEIYIQEKYIELKTLSYKNRSIQNILKGKINEKN